MTDGVSMLDISYCKFCKRYDVVTEQCEVQRGRVSPNEHCALFDFDSERYAAAKAKPKITTKEAVFVNVNEPEDDDDKPIITLPVAGKLISTFGGQVIVHIKDRHIIFYRYREFKVQKLEQVPIKDVQKRNVQVLGFKDITPKELVTHIERYIIPGIYLWDSMTKKTKFEPKSITDNLAGTLLESAQFRDNLPLIDKIFDAPMPALYGGKLIFPKNGYDERFESWLPHDAPTINPDMPLAEAKELLNGIYGEFCFETPQDKTNAIAALLTPFIRGLYTNPTSRTPIFFYKANRERAGKDYCAEITGVIMQGVANSEPPLADGKETHDEEFRKKILATFRIGKNRLHFSNNRGFLNSAQLEYVSTTDTFSDRVLGSNTTLSFPNTLEISLSANTGITYTPDLANRCIFINLFLEMENPNEREFQKPDLHGWCKAHRSEILSALYTLVRNWHEQGMPPGKTFFASFPEWARVCGGIMVAAELGDPCIARDDSGLIGGDAETKDMKRLFGLVFERWGSQPILKKEILNAMCGSSEADLPFHEVFAFIDWSKEHAARTMMGKIIDKFVGRIFSNIKLYRVDDSHLERRKYIWKKIEKPVLQQQSLGILGGLGDIGVVFPALSSSDPPRGGTGVGGCEKTPQTPPNPPNDQNIDITEYISICPDRGVRVGECETSPLSPTSPTKTAKNDPNDQNIDITKYISICPDIVISPEVAIRNYMSEKADGIKISDLQLETGIDFDQLCAAVDKLKSAGEIMENPAGTIRKL